MDIILQTGFGYETSASITNYDETLKNIKNLKDITILRVTEPGFSLTGHSVSQNFSPSLNQQSEYKVFY